MLPGKTVPNEFEVDLINSNNEKRTCEIHSSNTIFEDQNVELVIIRDITDVKQMEAALQYRVELERLVTGISTHFINLAPDEVDSGINRVLQEIGEFVNVARSYVFLFYDNGMKMDNTHEWCAEGIEPQIDNLQGLPAETLPWWMERLNRFENIHIPSVADLPPKANAEKEILQAQGIKSLIVVPIIYGRSLFGFLGFDSVQGKKRCRKTSSRC